MRWGGARERLLSVKDVGGEVEGGKGIGEGLIVGWVLDGYRRGLMSEYWKARVFVADVSGVLKKAECGDGGGFVMEEKGLELGDGGEGFEIG